MIVIEKLALTVASGRWLVEDADATIGRALDDLGLGAEIKATRCAVVTVTGDDVADWQVRWDRGVCCRWTTSINERSRIAPHR